MISRDQTIMASGAYQLYQQQDRLVLGLLHRHWELCPLEANKLQHIAVVYRSGKIVAYRDGQQVLPPTTRRPI